MRSDIVIPALDAYQKFTPTTALYPKELEVAYLTLGLSGELAELISDLDMQATTKGTYDVDLVHELGDVFWYVSQLANVEGIRLSAFVSYVFGLALPINQDTVIHNCLYYVGLFSNTAKKQLRDGKEVYPELANMVGVVIQQLVLFCIAMKINVADVLAENEKKLTDRQDRGMIQGDGDNR